MSKVCPGCGTRPTDFDHDHDAWVGDVYQCEGCLRRAQEENNIPTDPDGTKQPGWHVRLVTKVFARQRALELAEKTKDAA